MVNNKRLGTAFEHEVCELLANKGYWVHFMAPDARGAQPFDIIAVKNGFAFAIDCKTCVANRFNIGRLEENQIMAFEKWIRCNNTVPFIFIKHLNGIYVVDYNTLKKQKSVSINGLNEWEDTL